MDEKRYFQVIDPDQRGPVASLAPTCLYLEVTNECNLTCKTCPLTYGRVEPPALLSLEKVRFLVSQFPSATRMVLHGIGEPLLNPELPQIISYLKAEGKYVLFNSNATLLNAKWQQALIDSQLDEYRVSLDATTAESYAQVRGKPMFPLILTNIERFTGLKKRQGASHPRVSLWLTGLKETLPELPDFLRIAHRLGIEEVYLQRLVYWQDDNREKLATPDQSLFQSLPPSFPETGRPEVFAPPNLCNALLSHPEPPVQTAQCRATPCDEPRWPAAAPCWGSRRHRARGVAAREGSEDATEVFAGLRSGRSGAQMPFEIPIHLP